VTRGGGDGLQQQLEALFLEELQDNLRILNDGVVALESRGADTQLVTQLVTQLFRAAHSLKGAAHSASVVAAVSPCHRLEELFAQLRDGARGVDADALATVAEGLRELAAVERELSGPTSHQPTAPSSTPDATPAPTGGGAPAPEPMPAASGGRVDVRARVTVGRLDRLVERSGSLVATTHRVRSLVDDLDGLADSSGGGFAEVARSARELERHLRSLAEQVAEDAQQLRLQPFHDVTAGLDHAVRELCRSTGTDARLVVQGGDVELDRDIGDALREPLLHLVRNAVDHGIERPDDRSALGKTPRGTVRVAAAERSGHVAITVSDDGGGFDVDGLRAAIGEGAEAIDDVEVAFLPGVSTATVVTDVSGRGMGLDAARAKVEALGGTCQVRTERGSGTDIEIHVPRSLAVLRVLIVDTGDGDLVALPMAGITRLHRLGDDDVEHVEGRLAVALDGGRRPAVALAAALSMRAETAGDAFGVGVEVADDDGVLLVRRAVTEMELVLRPLPARVGASTGLLGAALLPTEEVALVANPSAALRIGLAQAAPPPPTPASARRSRVLLAEDTLTTRALERSILERAGYEVVVAVDGLDALERLRDEVVDVVVSDIDMPRMSGIDLCRAIRSSVQHGDLPVVLVTSLGSDEDRRRGLEAGASAYIVKSAFDQHALLDAVGRFV
jgi:two-component system chemotaxis sensor kinase CheA